MTHPVDEAEIAQEFRREFGQTVATLTRVFGDLDVAEDAVQEAFVVALRKWPQTGVPPNPGGWITTTARRRAIDRVPTGPSRGLSTHEVAIATCGDVAIATSCLASTRTPGQITRVGHHAGALTPGRAR